MAGLVRYAGFDPNEGQRGYYPRLTGGGPRQRAYVMFRAGKDTFEIAKVLKVGEHRVADWIEQERCAHRGLPLPEREKA